MRVTLNEESQAVWQSRNLEYLRYEYDLKPDDLVIDIGAYRGEWAQRIMDEYGSLMIAIEPTDNITQFAAFAGAKGVINKAAATYNGKMRFGGAYYYTSAHEEPTHEYECFDINSLLSKYEEIALVKINIEGEEYRLLNHVIDAGLHKRIRNLQVQFHQIEDEPFEELYGAIASKLRETHHLTFYYPFCWENWRRT